MPGPHVALHGDHAPQGDHTGHVASLHSLASSLSPGHVSPPSQRRTRVWLPSPQVALHALQPPHSVHSGHSSVAQDSNSSMGP